MAHTTMMTTNDYLHLVVTNVVECERYRGICPRKMYGYWLAYSDAENWTAFRTFDEANEAAKAKRAAKMSCACVPAVLEDSTLFVELS